MTAEVLGRFDQRGARLHHLPHPGLDAHRILQQTVQWDLDADEVGDRLDRDCRATASGYIGLHSASTATMSRPSRSPSESRYPGMPATTPCVMDGMAPELRACRASAVDPTPKRPPWLGSEDCRTNPSMMIRRSKPPLVYHSRTVFANSRSWDSEKGISDVKTPRSSPP